MAKVGDIKSVKTPVKAPISKKPIVKKPIITKSPSPTKVLSESSITLQKVIIDMTKKLDNLSNQISNLLKIFEQSAQALAKKEFDLEADNKNHQEIIKKIDNLFDQNKTIAQSVALLHEMPEEGEEPPEQQPPAQQPPAQPPAQSPPPMPPQQPPAQQPPPIQQMPPQQPPAQQGINMSEYKKSISATAPQSQETQFPVSGPNKTPQQ